LNLLQRRRGRYLQVDIIFFHFLDLKWEEDIMLPVLIVFVGSNVFIEVRTVMEKPVRMRLRTSG
jgi:hypothetical protein